MIFKNYSIWFYNKKIHNRGLEKRRSCVELLEIHKNYNVDKIVVLQTTYSLYPTKNVILT
jgi:hypothetical protein